jgi:hypothetical protein
MNRQFQNFSQSNSNSGRNMGSGNKHMYMERPTNLSQEQYGRNQGNRDQVYNPNPFNGRDTMSMSSQMSSMLNTETAIFNPTKPRFDNETEGDNTKKKEVGVLFYSSNCEHSKKFLLDLMKTKLNDLVRKICVDKSDIKIPSVVRSVPTLIARGINRPLVGEQVFAWLENETTKTAVTDDIKCFSFGCKDNYTFIEDGVDDGTVIEGNTADWDKDYMINAPLDTDVKETKKAGNDEKIATYKNDVAKMREERNAMLGKQNAPTAKNTKLDPDQFNQMFLKQQEQYSKSNGTSKFKQNVRNI